MSEIGILNVGTGDTKLSFDKNNPAERLRAARIVTDMLRRGYAILIEVDRDGVKGYERVREFREDTCEYIIADFDSATAEAADKEEANAKDQENGSSQNGGQKPKARKAYRPRIIKAETASGIAVGRTAGG